MFSLDQHGKYKRWCTNDQSQEESYFSKSSRSKSLHLFKTNAIEALIHCTEMKFYYIWHYRWQGNGAYCQHAVNSSTFKKGDCVKCSINSGICNLASPVKEKKNEISLKKKKKKKYNCVFIW